MLYLTDITGTLGDWLDKQVDDSVPPEVLDLLAEAYEKASRELDSK